MIQFRAHHPLIFSALLLAAACHGGPSDTSVTEDAIGSGVGTWPTEVETSQLCISSIFNAPGRYPMVLVSNRYTAAYASFATGFLDVYANAATGVFSHLYSDRIDFEELTAPTEGTFGTGTYLAQPFDANVPDYFDIRINSNMMIHWNDHTWGGSGDFAAKCVNQMLTFSSGSAIFLLSIGPRYGDILP